MSKRMIILSAVLLFSFGLMCAANVPTGRGLNLFAVHSPAVAEPQAPALDCTDRKAVAKAIYAHLKKNGFKTKTILDRINVRYNPRDKVITLEGFVLSASQSRLKRAGKLASEATTCTTNVDNQLTPGPGHGCTPPNVPCGKTALCLPADECNVGKVP